MDKKVIKKLNEIKNRYDAKRCDYGVPGMQWGHHKAKTEQANGGVKLNYKDIPEVFSGEHKMPEGFPKRMQSFFNECANDTLNDIINEWEYDEEASKHFGVPSMRKKGERDIKVLNDDVSFGDSEDYRAFMQTIDLDVEDMEAIDDTDLRPYTRKLQDKATKYIKSKLIEHFKGR